MVIETKLPRIDSKTKHRVMEYFEKVTRTATVKLDYVRDGLPEGIKLARIIRAVPNSEDDQKAIFVNDEAMSAVIVTYADKNHAGKTYDELTVAIYRLANKNSDGIPCGSIQENYKFSGENLEWLLSLAPE